MEEEKREVVMIGQGQHEQEPDFEFVLLATCIDGFKKLNSGRAVARILRYLNDRYGADEDGLQVIEKELRRGPRKN